MRSVQAIEIVVPVNGVMVRQVAFLDDLGFTTAMPVHGMSSFPIRYFHPWTQQPDGVLAELHAATMRGQPDRAVLRERAQHVVGTYLNPESVLNHGPLSIQRLEHFLGRSLSGPEHAFEPLIAGYLETALPEHLDSELVHALTGLPYGEAAARVMRARDDRVTREALREHSKMWSHICGNNIAFSKEATAVEQKRFHRVRQKLVNRFKYDTKTVRVAAYLYSNESEGLVAEAHRLILDALRTQHDLSVAEVRLYEQINLPWQPLSSSPLSFRGILGQRPFLLEILRWSPTTVAYLVLARCWGLPRELQAMYEQDFRWHFVGALRAALQVLDAARDEEKMARSRGRARPAPGSRTQSRAVFVLKTNSHLLKPKQLGIIRPLADGATLAAVGREQGIPYQNVQGILDRAWKRATETSRAPTPSNAAGSQASGRETLCARPLGGGPNGQRIATAVIRRRPLRTTASPAQTPMGDSGAPGSTTRLQD